MSQGNMTDASRAESKALVAEINKWCRRTGTNYNKLVGLARVSPSLRSGIVYRGKCVTVEVAARLRKAMRDNPHGIKAVRYSGQVCDTSATLIMMEAERINRLRVVREICSRCGSVNGCEHILSASPLQSRMG